MNFRSKWTMNNILSFLEEEFPETYFKILGMSKYNSIQIGNFRHNEYGRLFATKLFIKRENKTLVVFKTENPPKSKKSTKSNKAFMNEWIKKELSKKIV